MVNLIRGKIGTITEFNNVNIIGDGNELENRHELHLTNVSLVGNYRNGFDMMSGYFYGNLDIEGDFPYMLGNQAYTGYTEYGYGYLTIWAGSDDCGMNGFAVVHVKPTNSTELEKIGNSNSFFQGMLVTLQAIVFESRMSSYSLADYYVLGDWNFPHAYKVVRDPASGQLKFTGSTSDGFDAKDASDTSEPVPSLDPEEWRIAGNSGSSAGYFEPKPNPATTTWGALDSSKKWSPGAFASIP
jgi:hypothetical protein